VIRTRVGYAGGDKEKPTYRSLGDHHEAVQVTFDPDRITFRDLLAVFWEAHDPYRGGGYTQYQPVLWTHGEEQAKTAQAFVAAEEKESGKTAKTPVLPAPRFWLAEDYHQKYQLRHDKDLLRALLGPDWTDRGLRDSTVAARVNGWLSGYGTPEEIAAEVKDLGLGEEARAALEKALGDRAPALCGAPPDPH
jgi:peptide-methionine (S)-S-oxide reductase